MAIESVQGKSLPYFSFEIQSKNPDHNENLDCMIDTGADRSVVHRSVVRRYFLFITPTNMAILGAGGQQTSVDHITTIPLVIEGTVHPIPAMVSNNKYFKDRAILGKDFFTTTDSFVRADNNDQWVLMQSTSQGTRLLSRPQKIIKATHMMTHGKKPQPKPHHCMLHLNSKMNI